MKDYIKFTPEQIVMLLRLISIQADKKISDIPSVDTLDFNGRDLAPGESRVVVFRTIKNVWQNPDLINN